MTPIEEQEHHRQREKHFFIPAGALIGLGAGLIAGHPVPGILIGLGLGFCAQALFVESRKYFLYQKLSRKQAQR